ncbi:MAG: phosphohydrolase, partial [Clostridia bacterium]|nr:phosphohydrolase [Clostridia bacterium]
QVQNMTYSIHGRVNFAVTDSKLLVDETKKSITLKIEIDTSLCSVADYFEIFLKRMLMCKKAAEFLGGSFHLEINDSKLL